MNRKFIVSTHLGDFTTIAVSERKAINNVRFRLYGRSDCPWEVDYWVVKEVGV